MEYSRVVKAGLDEDEIISESFDESSSPNESEHVSFILALLMLWPMLFAIWMALMIPIGIILIPAIQLILILIFNRYHPCQMLLCSAVCYTMKLII